jgi:hypothetical protein
MQSLISRGLSALGIKKSTPSCERPEEDHAKASKILSDDRFSILDNVDPLIVDVYAHRNKMFAESGLPPATPPTTPSKDNPIIQEFVRMSQFKAWVAAEQAQRAYRDYFRRHSATSDGANYDEYDESVRKLTCDSNCEQIRQRAAYYSTLTDVEAVYVGFANVREPLYSFCIGVAQMLKTVRPAGFNSGEWTIDVLKPGDVWPPPGRKLDGEGFLIAQNQTRYDAFEHVLVSPLALDQYGVVEGPDHRA